MKSAKDPEDKPKKKHPILGKILPGIIIIILVWGVFSWIPVTETIYLDLFPGEDTGVRLLLLTDLHSCYYGKDQKDLLSMIEKASPDVVLLGGDFFDDVLSEDNAKITAEYLSAHYPTYYVTGNHEFWSGRVDDMKDYLRDLGIYVLEGDCQTITVNGHTLDICGIDDPDEMTETEWRAQIDRAYAQMTEADNSAIRILLTHRPEKVSVYEQYDFDLVLAGHAHAGQIYIPFLKNGLFAPDQGLFAKYVNGAYTLSNGSTMIVSRGLGRESTIAPRYFNHPELVVVELY